MFDPNVTLAVFAVLTACYLGESAWRLRRHKPAKYMSLVGEGVLAFALLFGMLTVLKADDALHVAAKIAVMGTFAAATTLRLIARNRFAES